MKPPHGSASVPVWVTQGRTEHHAHMYVGSVRHDDDDDGVPYVMIKWSNGLTGWVRQSLVRPVDEGGTRRRTRRRSSDNHETKSPPRNDLRHAAPGEHHDGTGTTADGTVEARGTEKKASPRTEAASKQSWTDAKASTHAATCAAASVSDKKVRQTGNPTTTANVTTNSGSENDNNHATTDREKANNIVSRLEQSLDRDVGTDDREGTDPPPKHEDDDTDGAARSVASIGATSQALTAGASAAQVEPHLQSEESDGEHDWQDSPPQKRAGGNGGQPTATAEPQTTGALIVATGGSPAGSPTNPTSHDTKPPPLSTPSSFHPKLTMEHYDISDRDIFPEQLFKLLRDVKELGIDHILSWEEDGKTFRMHNEKKFLKLLHQLSHNTKVISFRNTLGQFNFQCVEYGANGRAFRHVSAIPKDDKGKTDTVLFHRDAVSEQIQQVKRRPNAAAHRRPGSSSPHKKGGSPPLSLDAKTLKRLARAGSPSGRKADQPGVRRSAETKPRRKDSTGSATSGKKRRDTPSSLVDDLTEEPHSKRRRRWLMAKEGSTQRLDDGTWSKPDGAPPAAGLVWDRHRGMWETNRKDVVELTATASPPKRTDQDRLPSKTKSNLALYGNPVDYDSKARLKLNRNVERATRRTSDGCLFPKSRPIQNEDGTFSKPTGSEPRGLVWDAVRGLWAPPEAPMPTSRVSRTANNVPRTTTSNVPRTTAPRTTSNVPRTTTSNVPRTKTSHVSRTSHASRTTSNVSKTTTGNVPRTTVPRTASNVPRTASNVSRTTAPRTTTNHVSRTAINVPRTTNHVSRTKAASTDPSQHRLAVHPVMPTSISVRERAPVKERTVVCLPAASGKHHVLRSSPTYPTFLMFKKRHVFKGKFTARTKANPTGIIGGDNQFMRSVKKDNWARMQRLMRARGVNDENGEVLSQNTSSSGESTLVAHPPMADLDNPMADEDHPIGGTE